MRDRIAIVAHIPSAMHAAALAIAAGRRQRILVVDKRSTDTSSAPAEPDPPKESRQVRRARERELAKSGGYR